MSEQQYNPFIIECKKCGARQHLGDIKSDLIKVQSDRDTCLVEVWCANCNSTFEC